MLNLYTLTCYRFTTINIQVLTVNCAGWLFYGCIIQDTYLMFSVSFGLPINLFATASALRILGSKKVSSRVSEEDFIVNGQAPIDFSKQIELILIGGVCMWIFVAFIAGSILPAAYDNPTSMQYNLVGNVCMITSILYYVSPLSVLLDIVRKKDASGLHLPMILLNLLATTLWSSYGLFSMNDVNVYVPNMLAMALSISQLCIKGYYPSNFGKKQDDKYEMADKTSGPMEEGFSPIHHYDPPNLTSSSSVDKDTSGALSSSIHSDDVTGLRGKYSATRFVEDSESKEGYTYAEHPTVSNMNDFEANIPNVLSVLPSVPLLPPPPPPRSMPPGAPLEAIPYQSNILPVEAQVPFGTSDAALHAENIAPLYAPPPVPAVPPPSIIQLLSDTISGRSRSSTREDGARGADSYVSDYTHSGAHSPFFGVRSRSNTRNSQQENVD